MSLKTFFILVVLTTICWAAEKEPVTYTRCDQLPKVKFNITDDVYTFHYGLTNLFDCSHFKILKKTEGIAGIANTKGILIKGGKALTVDYNTDESETKIDVTYCSSGHKYNNWYNMEEMHTETGSFRCAYICSKDGSAFQEFSCLGTDPMYMSYEKAVIAKVQGIKNADKIHKSQEKCVESEFCKNFL